MPRSTAAAAPTSASKQPNADLLAVAVQNFGPIAQAKVNLRPLTILVGRTNTGKTCFSKLVCAIHKTFSGFPQIPYFGCDYDPMGNRDSLDLLLSGLGNHSETECQKQEIKNHVFRCFELNRHFGNDQILEEIGHCFGTTDISAIRRERSQRKDFKIDILRSESATDTWRVSIGLKQSKASVDAEFDPNAIEFADSTCEDIVSKIERHVDLASLRNEGGTMGLDPHKIEHPLLDLAYPDSGNRQNSYFLPANRAGILESHKFIADALLGHVPNQGPRYSSALQLLPRVSVDFIQTMMVAGDRPQAYLRKPAPSGARPLEAVAKFMEDELIGGKLHANASTEAAFPVFEFAQSHAKQPLRLDAASSMVSELAPIIVIVRFHLSPFDLLIIEEPEAHLHPGELPLLAKCLARLVRSSVRVLISTHSDWLLKSLRNLILEGDLIRPGLSDQDSGNGDYLLRSEVGAWEFTASDDLGGTTVDEVAFDELDGVEPLEFERLSDQLYNESVAIRNAKARRRRPDIG